MRNRGGIERPGIFQALGNHEGRTRGLELGLVDLSWGLFSASPAASGSGLTTIAYDTWTTNAEETFDLDLGTGRANIIAEGAYVFFQSLAIENGGAGIATDWADLSTFHTGDASSLPLGIFTPFFGSPSVQGDDPASGAGLEWYPHLFEMRVYDDVGTSFPAEQWMEITIPFDPGDNIASTLIVRISNPTPAV